MKKVILMAMAVAAMAACSKNESAPEVDRGEKQQLNILTSVGTRAVVAGVAMPQGSAIGVHVTQGALGSETAYAGQNYVAGGVNLEFGDNVRFDNETTANKWVSQTAGSQAANLMIGAVEGTIYGYYPYAAAVTGVGAVATIPAGTLATGDIDLTSAIDGSKNYAETEVDYLYYKPAADRAKVKSNASTTAPLTMAHAMASVSFRMYVSLDAPVFNDGDEHYYLMGYTIQNKQGKTLFEAGNSNVTMNIADGTVANSATPGATLTRRLNEANGYALTRVAAADATTEEKAKLVWFGNLTFPIPAINHQVVNGVDCSDDIEIVFSIKKGLSGTAQNYVVPLVVDAVTGSDKWEAGKNYQYTVKLNAFLELGIQEVTVADWVNVVGGDITIE